MAVRIGGIIWRPFKKYLFGSFLLANMIVVLPYTVSRSEKQFLEGFQCWLLLGLLFVCFLANVRQYFEMDWVTGWHVTTMRRWHGLS